MTGLGWSWLWLSGALLLAPTPAPAAARLAWITGHRSPAPRRSALHPGLQARWAGLTSRPAVLAAAAGSVAGGVSRSLAAAVAAGILGGAAGAVLRVAVRERAAQGSLGELATVVAGLADEYEAGAGIDAALAAVAPTAGPLAPTLLRAAAASAAGEPVGALLAAEPSLRPLAIGCTVATHNGVGLGPVLAGVLSDVRDGQDVHRAVQAALAGPRMSMVLLAVLPGFGLTLGAAMGARPVRVLLHTGVGTVSLLTGCLLDAVGVLWVLRLSVRAQP